MFALWHAVFIIAALLLDHALGIASIDLSDTVAEGVTIGPLTVIYLLALMVPNFAIACRRLHDLGRTGWLQLVGVIPFVGIVVLVLYGWPGQSEANKYGPVPGESTQIEEPPTRSL